MNKYLFSNLLIAIMAVIFSNSTTNAQVPFANSNYDIVLTGGPGTGSNRSGVAYNPYLDIYYGNIAGNATYQFETFDNTGTLINTATANIDVRGVWWNPVLDQLEMNTFSSGGIYSKNLDVNGYATATNTLIQAANSQPNAQSFGQYDWINNHFIYYNAGSIVRVNRATNAIVSTNVITGIPAGSNITDFALGFTGIPNYEIVIYDYTNRRALFVNGTTYAYVTATQFPNTAIATNWFNVAYANKRLFLCNTTERKWYGYPLFEDSCTGTPDGGNVFSITNILLCGDSTNLTLNNASSANGIVYQWQYSTTGAWIPFGTSTTNLQSPPITQTTMIRCMVTCTSSNGGTSYSDTLSIITTPISINIGNDTTICPGITQTLDATNIAGSSYLWFPGNATTPTRNINTPGVYSVRVTQPNGCIGRDTITVTAGLQPVNNLAPTYNLCADSTIDLDAGNATGCTFLWTPTSATTQTITVNNAGNYSVLITSEDNCELVSATNVIYRPRPILTLPPVSTICSIDSILLDATTPLGDTYIWSTGATTPSIYAKDSILYSVTVTSEHGCPSWDETSVEFFPDPTTDGFTFIPYFYEELGKVTFAPINPQAVTNYYWYFGDGDSSYQHTPTHVYKGKGIYLVTLIVANNCTKNTYTQNVHINLPTGILSTDEEMNISIYPNPATDKLTIDNKSNKKLNNVQVYNALGAIVYNAEIKNNTHEINLSGLAAGIYHVKVQAADNNWMVKKIEVK